MRQRKQATAAGGVWLRDRESRDLAEDASASRAKAGEPFAIRFRVPDGDGATRFDDAVYGPQERKHRDTEDFALLRPDGSPLYNHVVVCDDVHMRITEIIRGQDHLSNTHKQILLYQALATEAPRFAHLPLINAPDRTKLSKRKHGEVVSVTTYRDRGFLPEAFRNFLALLGWSPGDDREFFTTEELVQAFSLEGIGRSNAILNFSETDPRQWTDKQGPLLEPALHDVDAARCALAAGGSRASEDGPLGRDLGRGRNASGVVRQGRRPPPPPLRHPRGLRGRGTALFRRRASRWTRRRWTRTCARSRASRSGCPSSGAASQALDPFDAATAEAALRAYADEIGAKAGVLINGARTATTGRSVGPSLFHALEVLGRDRVVRRLLDVPRLL